MPPWIMNEPQTSSALTVKPLGHIRYQQGLIAQKEAFEVVASDPSKAIFLICEHSPTVITIGHNGKKDSVIASQSTLRELGVEVVCTHRGGDATIHFVGQIVIYPIVSLKHLKLGVRKFIRLVESSVIGALANLGIPAFTLSSFPGIWVRDGQGGQFLKLCALGFRVQRGITTHGIAINVSKDLSAFDLIKPCGLASVSHGVTSVLQMLTPDEVAKTGEEKITMEVCQQTVTLLAQNLGYLKQTHHEPY